LRLLDWSGFIALWPNVSLVDRVDIDEWLAVQEAAVPNLRPACAKTVVWAGEKGVQTDVAVVFIHGFSATYHEIRPLPDLVAKALGANLHFTRLNGHGQDGTAMGKATLHAWRADVAEALDVAHIIGKRVLIIGCSTGCTLAADALANGTDVAGLVCVSPNFGLTHRIGQALLDLPYVRHWGHLIAGKNRSFDVHSDAHGAYWTTSYPTRAVYPMGDAVRAVRSADLSTIRTPAFFAYNPADQVVSAKQTERVMARWGGRAVGHKLIQGPDDDAMGHVMAGDVFSPAQTEPLVAAILRWFEANNGA
jgi:esterase/lipase